MKDAKEEIKIAKFIRMTRTTSNVIYPLYSARVSFWFFIRRAEWNNVFSTFHQELRNKMKILLTQCVPFWPSAPPLMHPHKLRLSKKKRQSHTHMHPKAHIHYASAPIHTCQQGAFVTCLTHASLFTAYCERPRRTSLCKYTVRNVQLTFYESLSLERTHEQTIKTEFLQLMSNAEPFCLSLIPCKGLLEGSKRKITRMTIAKQFQIL